MPFSNHVEKHQQQLLTSVRRADAALAQHGEDSSAGGGSFWPRLRSEPKQPQIRRSLESKQGEQIGIISVI